jgi:hypothetical protein
MSGTRYSDVDLREAVHGFVMAGATGELTEQQWTDFERLLRESDDACRLYAQYVGISVLLPPILSSVPDEESSPSDGPATMLEAVFVPPAAFLGSPWHGGVGDSLQTWLAAYMAAAVFLGLAILAGSLIHVSHPEQARTNLVSVSPVVRGAKAEPVGRVTGTFHCVWTDSKGGFADGDFVPLGGKFALTSGWLEISYDTGAKVILQGPCIYEVNSEASGFLSLGKLTALVEKRGKGRGTKSERTANPALAQSGSTPAASLALRSSANGKPEIPNPQSLIADPLFSVHTPTAVVTDRGTEFGVEVDRRGETESYVFQGKVELRPSSREPMANGRAAPRAVILEAGRSARVARPAVGGEPMILAASPAVVSQKFARVMPASSSRPVTVWTDWGPVGSFQAAGNDLINAGRPTLESLRLTSGSALFKSDADKLNDGAVYGSGKAFSTIESFAPSHRAVVTITLNIAAHPSGYDVHSIVSLTGFTLPRAGQRYDLEYSTVDHPGFIRLAGDHGSTVNRFNDAAGEVRVTLLNGNLPIASGVHRLRFTFYCAESSTPESVYREIDVLGAPTRAH